MNWREISFWAAYVLGAVATFGHAANQSHLYWRGNFDECMALDGDYQRCFKIDPAVVVGGISAIGWPLYWSWYAFDRRAVSA